MKRINSVALKTAGVCLIAYVSSLDNTVALAVVLSLSLYAGISFTLDDKDLNGFNTLKYATTTFVLTAISYYTKDNFLIVAVIILILFLMYTIVYTKRKLKKRTI